MSSPEFQVYQGPLDRAKMSKEERQAYEAYCAQKARSKKAGLPAPTYGAREFVGWWLENLKSFTGQRPTTGRIDHSKGYSFDNIEMQEMAMNSREGMLRNRTNINTAIKAGKRVGVYAKGTDNLIAVIPSIRETANLFNVSQRLVQFVVRGKYKSARNVNFDLRGVA